MIRLDGVGKTYADGTIAVQQLDLDVPRGSLVTLVGPSGCGKSTTLRMVNRLIEPTSGTITLDGEDVTRVDPVDLRRRIGYVIQQVGLFPHQTVRTNVATVATLLGWERKRTHERVDELLSLVGLEPQQYANRYPHQLSGGQRQRVGVARALVADPPVLLMDEPFGAVDPVVRTRLQDEFVALQERLGTTVLFVTHDIEEAVRLGERVGVFEGGGRLAQYDSPARVLGAPADEFVADFVGADRGLRRLAVTPIDDRDLEHPPLVTDDDDLGDARATLAREQARWAVVTDRSGDLRGWLGVDEAEGTGRVTERGHRMDAWVPRDSSLKDALSRMLQHDAGWVAVLDGSRLCGVLTPTTLHEALRRSIGADDEGVEAGAFDVETAGPVHG
ncbi:MAG: ATP-binding cassette domain-containing protein [Nocardioidaceae bacterium]|jgi:osmoprotectant transport system ATP-binding protein|nr:ATP-binding cassette domain-containing protein [Nocardioidaceae bacterium]